MNTATDFIPMVKRTGKEDYEIILEGLEFMFQKSTLKEIAFMHNRGFSVTEISRKVKRDEYETLLAIMHLHLKGRLTRPLRRI